MVESALEDKTLIKLEVRISVQVYSSRPVHFLVIPFDMIDQSGYAIGNLLIGGKVFFRLLGLL